MTSNDTTTLVHLVGFIAGVALYAMLAVMTVRDRRGSADRIPLATALLGLVWNSVALVIYGLHDFGLPTPIPPVWPWLVALAFSALGFLPAVVVHSAVQSAVRGAGAPILVRVAYAVSAIAAALQFVDAGRGATLPSRAGLLVLTIGYAILIGALVRYARGQPGWRRALAAVALAAFAVMALHLSQHTAGSDSWPTELLGHHASLPLAVVILYQDYRFAFADLFLKRALTLVVLLAGTIALYQLIAAPFIVPLLLSHGGAPGPVAALLGLWTLTALAYPPLRRAVNAVVDRLILRRTDYRDLREAVATRVATLDDEAEILDAGAALIASAVPATNVRWSTHAPAAPHAAAIAVVTTDGPTYTIALGGVAAGRRLLSDDIAALDAVGVTLARRIDAVRVQHERFGRDLREREILQLATEARLSALRAQLNPHFLFNALTTIGHLIEEAPPRALATLLRLTALLRAVLTRADGGLTTLGDELDLVRDYLAIEGARFEERLTVRIEIDERLLDLPLPPLLLQPLVENAVKHGISPRRRGGLVEVTARESGRTVTIAVRDTGVGVEPGELARRRTLGIGLANVEARLGHYYPTGATLSVASTPGEGTLVLLHVPAPAPIGPGALAGV
jgi:two-component system LytT family sensor kinase